MFFFSKRYIVDAALYTCIIPLQDGYVTLRCSLIMLFELVHIPALLLHCLFESVLMLFTKNYQNYSLLGETTACHSWRVFLNTCSVENDHDPWDEKDASARPPNLFGLLWPQFLTFYCQSWPFYVLASRITYTSCQHNQFISLQNIMFKSLTTDDQPVWQTDGWTNGHVENIMLVCHVGAQTAQLRLVTIHFESADVVDIWRNSKYSVILVAHFLASRINNVLNFLPPTVNFTSLVSFTWLFIEHYLFLYSFKAFIMTLLLCWCCISVFYCLCTLDNCKRHAALMAAYRNFLRERTPTFPFPLPSFPFPFPFLTFLSRLLLSFPFLSTLSSSPPAAKRPLKYS